MLFNRYEPQNPMRHGLTTTDYYGMDRQTGRPVAIKVLKEVYSADPKLDKNARRFDRLSHNEAIERDLKVMDGTAFALARENRIPIIVFSIREPGGIAAVLSGKGRATIVG